MGKTFKVLSISRVLVSQMLDNFPNNIDFTDFFFKLKSNGRQEYINVRLNHFKMKHKQLSNNRRNTYVHYTLNGEGSVYIVVIRGGHRLVYKTFSSVRLSGWPGKKGIRFSLFTRPVDI